METQTQFQPETAEFQPGTPVIYAMHGRCKILQTEIRNLGGESIRFYKLELRKSSFSRSNKQDPAIWVPVTTAKALGLRLPMTKEEAENAIKLLQSREYFFDPYENWNIIQPQLELALLKEGGLGLAKVVSFLYVLKKKQVVPTPEVMKFYESTQKLLFRELSDILEQPIRVLEEKTAKGLKSKLLPDN